MKNLKIIIIKKDIDYSWLWLWEPPKIDNLAAGIPPNPNLQLYTKKMINHGLQMLALTSTMEDTDSKASGQEGDHSAQEANPTDQAGNPAVQEGTPSGKEGVPSDQAGNPAGQEANPTGQEVEKHINLKVITGMEM